MQGWDRKHKILNDVVHVAWTVTLTMDHDNQGWTVDLDSTTLPDHGQIYCCVTTVTQDQPSWQLWMSSHTPKTQQPQQVIQTNPKMPQGISFANKASTLVFLQETVEDKVSSVEGFHDNPQRRLTEWINFL